MRTNIILFLGLLLFQTTTCFAQNNYAKYYKEINDAELAICSNNSSKAIKHYQNAFKCMNPFSTDLINYVYLSANTHIGDLTMVESCMTKLAQRELLFPDWFSKDSILFSMAESIKMNTASTIDTSLTNLLQQLVDEDQKNRFYTSDEELHRRDSVNMSKLIPILSLGINENNTSFPMDKIWLIYWHCSKSAPEMLRWDILKKEIDNGNLDARWYMSLFDGCRFNWYTMDTTRTPLPSFYGAGAEIHICVHKTLFIYPPDNLKEINIHRKKLGISETWQNFKKKLIYSFTTTNGIGLVSLQTDIWGDDAENEAAANDMKNQIHTHLVKGEYYDK